MDSIIQLRNNPNFDLQSFQSTADKIAPAFFEKTKAMMELVDSSILFSDGLCVCTLCEMYGVDYLVESGTGFGGSTEMFARYFADDPKVKGIFSVDLMAHPVWSHVLDRLRIKRRDHHVWSSRRRAKQIARKRLRQFRKVELVRGDARSRLPAIVSALDAKRARVGVVIDGPKEAPQMALAHRLLESSSSVCFVALDDIGPIFNESGRYTRFCNSKYAVFATSDPRFYARYGWVNNDRLPARMRNQPNHTGYGLGVLVNLPIG